MRTILSSIDNALNRVTMYRLALYELVALVLAAMGLSFVGGVSSAPLLIAGSAVFFVVLSLAAEFVFARVFDSPVNPESAYITGLILALIIAPPAGLADAHYLPLAAWAALWAIASKHLFALRGKHVFNPAAAGAAIPALVLGQSATWWVGTAALAPFVAVGGLLMVRKLRRFDLFLSFFATALAGMLLFTLSRGGDLWSGLVNAFTLTPLLFFGTVMLTEPLTAPPTRMLRMCYGVFVGILFWPNMHFGSFYLTPEAALLIGNIYSFAVSPKYRLLLHLVARRRLTQDTYEFAFAADRPMRFRPGQYMEWTLPHRGSDTRGARRYFTLASSPTERELKLGVKFYSPASSFKKALAALGEGGVIAASSLAGDFTLPKNKEKKLAFIAGGIGITPYRSMLQYLLDTKERRDITLLYGMRAPADVAYGDVIARAQSELGAKVAYAYSDLTPEAAAAAGAHKLFDAAAIAKEVPDYRERVFYVSGPQGMVAALRATLAGMGVAGRNIKTDYFPGFV